MSLTHYDGQKLIDCHSCEGSIRLKALRSWKGEAREVHCDRCDSDFTVSKEELCQ